jgi:valine dehydrogenase (NAD+)
MADADGIPPAVAADRLAERRIAEVGRLRGIYLGR